MLKRICSLLLLLSPGAIPTMAQLPPVKHVFVIMLENKGYAETFGSNSAGPDWSQNRMGSPEA